ncbi:MAG TPA: YciI family protein [Polyangiaceae bacterium]|nr:YciI family protein [Polyangiaceae bacterium]
MQFLIVIKLENNTDYEAGKPLPEGFDAKMGLLMGEWAKQGVMLSAAGLKPTSRGSRVRLSSGKVSVTDGPFTEAKEVIGGFFMIEAKDKAAALELTRAFVDLHRGSFPENFLLECELREVNH